MTTMTTSIELAGSSAEQPTATTRKEPAPQARERRLPDLVYSVASVVLLLVAWTVVSHSSFIKPGYLPTPESLWNTFIELVREGYQGHPLSEHIKVSLLRTLAGFAAVNQGDGIFQSQPAQAFCHWR